MRKSPYRHKVRKHRRQGRDVTSYKRGRGDKPIVPQRMVSETVRETPREGTIRGDGKSYNVTVYYVGASEKLTVEAPNYGGAVKSGIQQRGKTDVPTKMSIRGVR